MVEALLREPAVAFLAAESEAGGFWIGSRNGDAHLSRANDEISYQPRSGDPLLLGCNWTGSLRQSLERTWDGPYPDAVFHLFDQFRSQRSGDLLVVAQQGYDFRGRFEFPEHRSGHGSMIRAHMQTPVWSNQPIPGGPLRTVDLFPAMLEWLGIEIPSGIDGCSAGPNAAGRSSTDQPRMAVTV
jgi:hypothetical protein